jgi:hypothetical protein
MSNYIVVLFKNKSKKKIINKFVTSNKAKQFYDDLINESNSVIFHKEYESGVSSNFELGLLTKNVEGLFPIYTTDELGRQIKVEIEDPEWKIIKIIPYKIEEELYDIQTEEKIKTPDIIKKYLKQDGVKMISKLNNKIIIQKDDDIKLFSLKNEYDSHRFIETLSQYFMSKNRMDVMCISDSSSAQKKYLYNLLESKGISKNILYRKFTTHPKKNSRYK